MKPWVFFIVLVMVMVLGTAVLIGLLDAQAVPKSYIIPSVQAVLDKKGL